MDVKTKVEELLQPYLNEDRYFIVEIQVSSSRNRAKITVLLDSDSGITIDECAEISRRLGHQLEELNVFDGGAFTLEVSSPGADQPLVLMRQYRKNLGREVSVLLNDGQIRIGRLEGVHEDRIIITEAPVKKSNARFPRSGGPAGKKNNESPPEPVAIPFTEIKRATIQLSLK